MTREQLHALKERIFERRNEPEMLKVMAVADELYSMCSYYGLFEEADTEYAAASTHTSDGQPHQNTTNQGGMKYCSMSPPRLKGG